MAIAKNIRVDPPISERDEIRQHVLNFKAYQERLARDREEFAASILKRLLRGRDQPAKMVSRKPMREKGWSRPFDDPIELPRGRQLMTLQDGSLRLKS
jgi:hypothetical protein